MSELENLKSGADFNQKLLIETVDRLVRLENSEKLKKSFLEWLTEHSKPLQETLDKLTRYQDFGPAMVDTYKFKKFWETHMETIWKFFDEK